MKTLLLCCLAVFCSLLAVANGGAKPIYFHKNSANGLDSVTRLLRLKLFIDDYNYDDIAIAFNSGASVKYDPNEDSAYWPGINAPEGLASISSDGTLLSLNALPLPKQAPLIIRLDAEAKNSGSFIMKRTQLDSLPPLYEAWLVDTYKKDSLDLKITDAYNFTIDKTDTNSFGKNRFYVVIRQNPALGLHLLGFTAIKSAMGSQIDWTTENEQDYTKFSVERSADNGITFIALDNVKSDAAGKYSFVDAAPPALIDQYRLRLEDMNGTVTFSEIVSLNYTAPVAETSTSASTAINVYPNPVAGTMNYAVNNSFIAAGAKQTFTTTPASSTPAYAIKIVSTTGAVVRSESSWQPNIPGDVSTLHPGTYIIQVLNNSTKHMVGQSKFVKL